MGEVKITRKKFAGHCSFCNWYSKALQKLEAGTFLCKRCKMGMTAQAHGNLRFEECELEEMDFVEVANG
jgi:hypothetical protein